MLTCFARLMVLALISLATVSVWAGSATTCARSVFETLSAEKYVCNACYDNIFRLARQLDQAGASLERSRVLYIYSHPEDKQIPLASSDMAVPLAARSGSSTRWFFHVVLIHEGLVYDFDYTKSPAPIDLATWVRKMWGGPRAQGYRVEGKQTVAQPLYYRSIAATSYLSLHRPRGTPLANGFRYDDWLTRSDVPGVERNFSEIVADKALADDSANVEPVLERDPLYARVWRRLTLQGSP